MRRLGLAFALLLTACGDPTAVPNGVDGIRSGDGGAIPSKPDTAVPDAGPSETTIVDGYPAGPYEAIAGAVFPPLSLAGFPDGSTTWGTLSMREYFDPDGAKGVRGVVVIVAAEWCEVCKGEARWEPNAYLTNYRAKGARFITPLVQDVNHKPATRATATTWRDVFSIPYAVAIDPDLATLPKGLGALKLPYVFVIDPRTMRVEHVYSAAQPPPTLPALDTVLARNAG